MKEKPILFNAEMVRAILDGRKTQTRRIVKPHPPAGFEWQGVILETTGDQRDVGKASWRLYPDSHNVRCPYGLTDDHLWVKEAWRIYGWHDGEPYYLQYKADGAKLDEPGDSEYMDEDKYLQYYMDSSDDCEKAGLKTEGDFYVFEDGEPPTRWRPSIFMPRWASRISLEITKMRVERLQDITYEDAVGEGTPGAGLIGGNIAMLVTGTDNMEDCEKELRKSMFASLWDEINKKRGYGWEVNPWVWVIDFERIDQ